MPDKTYDILIDIKAQVAAIDDAIAKIGTLNSATENTAANVTNAGEAAASTLARINPLIAGLAATLGIGLAGLFASVAAAALHAGDEIRKLADNEKLATDEVDKQIGKWASLLSTIQNAGQLSNLEQGLVGALDKAEVKLGEFEARTRSIFQFQADAIIGDLTFGSQRPFADANQAAIAGQINQINLIVQGLQATHAAGQQIIADYERLKAEAPEKIYGEVADKVAQLTAETERLSHFNLLSATPTPADLQRLNQQAAEFIQKSHDGAFWLTFLDELQGKIIASAKAFQTLTEKAQDALNAAARANAEQALALSGDAAGLAAARAEDAANAVRAKGAGIQDPILLAQLEKEAAAAAANVTAEYQKQQSLLAEHVRLSDEKTAAQQVLVSGNEQVGNQLLQENEIESRALEIQQQRNIGYDQAYAIAKQQVTVEDALKNSTQGEADARRTITDLLREDSALLHDLQQQQRLIEQNPSLGVGDKESLLGANAIAQQVELQAEIQRNQAALQGAFGPVTQEDVIRLTEKIGDLKFKFQELGFTIKTTTFGGSFQAELANWVNSWGTAGQQVARTIEGSINASLQATNQLLIGAVFHTGDWRQTIRSAEQSILSLFLTMLEQMALQQIAAALHITTNAGTQVAANTVIAASAAPAAAATSVASFGYAAIVGEIAAVAAIAAIIAALSGGFQSGGYTGDGAPNEIAGVVHRGEYVIPASVLQRYGVAASIDNIRSIVSAPSYQIGGLVGGGASSGGSLIPKINVWAVLDVNELRNRIFDHPTATNYVVNIFNRASRT